MAGGIQITVGQGTLTPQSGSTASLSGSSLTAALGTLNPRVSRTLVGQAIATATGNVQAPAGPLEDTFLSVAQGIAKTSISMTLTGQSLSIGQGTVSTAALTNPNLTGQSLSLAQGTLKAKPSRVMSSLAVAVNLGTLTPSGGVPAGTLVDFVEGVSGTSHGTGVHKKIANLTPVGGGYYTVTLSSGVSKNKKDSAHSESYIIDGESI